MSKNVLFITRQEPIYWKVKKILHPYQDRFHLIAQIDNSVVAKSIIQEIRPQIVLILQKIHFWDAEHLIHDKEIINIPVQYVILGDDKKQIDEIVNENIEISAGIIEKDFSDHELIDAMIRAEKDWEYRFGGKSNYEDQPFLDESLPLADRVDHDSKLLEDMKKAGELLSASNTSVFTTSDTEKLWVMIATVISDNNQPIYHYYSKISVLLTRLHTLFTGGSIPRPLGAVPCIVPP